MQKTRKEGARGESMVGDPPFEPRVRGVLGDGSGVTEGPGA